MKQPFRKVKILIGKAEADIQKRNSYIIVLVYCPIMMSFHQKCWPYTHPEGLVGTPGQSRDDDEEQFFDSRGSQQPICDTTMMFDIQ